MQSAVGSYVSLVLVMLGIIIPRFRSQRVQFLMVLLLHMLEKNRTTIRIKKGLRNTERRN